MTIPELKNKLKELRQEYTLATTMEDKDGAKVIEIRAKILKKVLEKKVKKNQESLV